MHSEKELGNYFRKHLGCARLVFIERPHTMEDHFKYKDKQAHLKRCNVIYKLRLHIHAAILILDKHKNFKFSL